MYTICIRPNLCTSSDSLISPVPWLPLLSLWLQLPLMVHPHCQLLSSIGLQQDLHLSCCCGTETLCTYVSAGHTGTCWSGLLLHGSLTTGEPEVLPVCRAAGSVLQLARHLVWRKGICDMAI